MSLCVARLASSFLFLSTWDRHRMWELICPLADQNSTMLIMTSQVLKANGYCFGKQSILDAITAIKKGNIVIVVDDYNCENEGDFIVSTKLLTAQTLAKLIRFSSGVVCVVMDDDKADDIID